MPTKPVKVLRFPEKADGTTDFVPVKGLENNRWLIIELQNGGRVQIELFEREGASGIEIRTVDGRPVITPTSGNGFVVDVKDFL